MLCEPSLGRPARPPLWQRPYLAAASGRSECGAGSSAMGLCCPALLVGCLLLRFALFCLCKAGQSSPGFSRKHFVLRREWLRATDAFLFLSICFGASSHFGAVFDGFTCGAGVLGMVLVCRTLHGAGACACDLCFQQDMCTAQVSVAALVLRTGGDCSCCCLCCVPRLIWWC